METLQHFWNGKEVTGQGCGNAIWEGYLLQHKFLLTLACFLFFETVVYFKTV